MKDPKLYLCIDNCFAYKRWVKPMDWMLLVKEMGAQYVEQSADTECDPLYHGAEYMRGWIRETREASEKTGVQVKNVYSGHGTYCTCGLTHWDPAVRRRFREQWMKPQADTARALGAGFGFYAHGFENSLLQDAAGYASAAGGTVRRSGGAGPVRRGDWAFLYWTGTDVHPPHAALDHRRGGRAGAAGICPLRRGHVSHGRSGTHERAAVLPLAPGGADSGSHFPGPGGGEANGCGLARRRPTDFSGKRWRESFRRNRRPRRFWRMRRSIPRLFPAGGRKHCRMGGASLGCYSPIIHLQQSDGVSSPHWPFSPEYNRRGVVSGEAFMESLGRAFAREDAPGMPPQVDEVALTLEPFLGTMANVYDAVEEIAQSVAYWRRFVPRDGMRLSEALALIKA